ncbi:high-affinity proline transporter PutP [Synergistales bacterium]|nr:high-affinity proline transporter PutP [Synergistales bacterium]
MSTFVVAAIFGLILYTIFCLVIGLGIGYKKEAVSTSKGYFLGGGIGRFVLLFTTAATWFSAAVFQGNIGQVYNSGIGWAVFGTWQFLTVICICAIGPRLWCMSTVRGHITPGDLVGDYYRSKLFKFIIGVGFACFAVPTMMGQMTAMGWAIETLTLGAIPFWGGLLYVTVVTCMYSFFGGFRSQAWVDTSQGILFTAIIWGSLLMVISTGGGSLSAVTARVNETFPDAFLYTPAGEAGAFPVQRSLSFFLLNGLGGFFAPYCWQRSQAAKRGSDLIKNGQVAMLLFALGIALPVTLIGMYSHAIPIEGLQASNAERVLTLFSAQYAPYWGIVVTVGILAAGMSTTSSIMVATSSIVAVDIVKLAKSDIGDSSIKNWGKGAIIALNIVAFLLALRGFNSVIFLVNIAVGGFIQISIPVLGIFAFKRMTKWGAMTGFIGGLLCTYLFQIEMGNPWGVWGGVWGLLCNAVICIVISAFTKPIDLAWRESFLRPLTIHSNSKL